MSQVGREGKSEVTEDSDCLLPTFETNAIIKKYVTNKRRISILHLGGQ